MIEKNLKIKIAKQFGNAFAQDAEEFASYVAKREQIEKSNPKVQVEKFMDGFDISGNAEQQNKERYDGNGYVNVAPGEREVVTEPGKKLDDTIKKERDDIEKAGSGFMIALMLPDDIAKDLAIEGGEKPKTLHVTLGYLGKQENLPSDALQRVQTAVEEACKEFGPVTGSVGGLGRFCASKSSDGKDVVYASFDSSVLPALRQKIVEAVDKTGIEIKKDHGYSPHITLAYIDPKDKLPMQRVEPKSFSISSVSLVIGNSKKIDIKLTGQRVMKRSGYAKTLPIMKMDAEKRIVIGVVYVPYDPNDPSTVDTQNMAATKEEIERAAYEFLENLNNTNIDKQHNFVGGYGCVVESYIAKAGDPLFVEGSWVMGVKVYDDKTWQAILDEEITGFSLAGDTVLEDQIPAVA